MQRDYPHILIDSFQCLIDHQMYQIPHLVIVDCYHKRLFRNNFKTSSQRNRLWKLLLKEVLNWHQGWNKALWNPTIKNSFLGLFSVNALHTHLPIRKYILKVLSVPEIVAQNTKRKQPKNRLALIWQTVYFQKESLIKIFSVINLSTLISVLKNNFQTASKLSNYLPFSSVNDLALFP